MVYDGIAIVLIIAIQSTVYAVLAQVQSWDVNPTTVFGVLISVLATAVVVLWRSLKEKEGEIKELNKILFKELKESRDEKGS